MGHELGNRLLPDGDADIDAHCDAHLNASADAGIDELNL
jgi:hypothetical protein